MEVVIRPASAGADVETVRALFDEYARGLAINLSFQGFAEEFREIAPYRHNPVPGALFLERALGPPPGEP